MESQLDKKASERRHSVTYDMTAEANNANSFREGSDQTLSIRSPTKD